MPFRTGGFVPARRRPGTNVCACSGGCAAAIAALRPVASWQDSPALRDLCRCCWAIVHRSLRRCGCRAAEAEDLTQEFFLRAIESRSLGQARLGSGCFRPYLLAAVRHFLLNQRAGERARKRGGEATFVAFEEDRTACRCSLTCPPPCGPEEQLERARFARAWRNALARVREDAHEEGARRRLETLLQHLDGPDRVAGYATPADELGMTEAAVRVALHRLRRKMASALRDAGYERPPHREDRRP